MTNVLVAELSPVTDSVSGIIQETDIVSHQVTTDTHIFEIALTFVIEAPDTRE